MIISTDKLRVKKTCSLHNPTLPNKGHSSHKGSQFIFANE